MTILEDDAGDIEAAQSEWRAIDEEPKPEDA